jgi:iron(III) transport system ATP-binding protein
MSFEIKDISMTYGDTPVLRHISATIKKGEFLSILGPSGCGKTTFLKILAGFLKPVSGTISMDGQLYSDSRHIVPTEKRDLGMVFQSFALWPYMNVREHVEFPLCHRQKHMSREERKKAVEEALDAAGLSGLETRYPDELSGGQKQRVSLARAIVAKPSLLLMDEPLSALDADLRISMRQLIQHIHRVTGTTVVYVTHDQGEALSLSDRIMILNHGEIEQTGTPQEVYLYPATAFTASFIGRCNLIEGTWNNNNFQAAGLPDAWKGDHISDCFKKESLYPVRPEQFFMTRAGKGLQGIVRGRLYSGREIHYTVEHRGKIMTIYEPVPSDFQIGEEVYLNCR